MAQEIRYQISRKIKKIRQTRGLTQAKLSDLSRVKYKYIQQIEGKNPPNLRIDTLARIAKALKLPTEKLLAR
jgi:transcriptional regulator with XRE-family HTH domain